jgi:predicted Zn-dependent protease
MRGGGRQRQVGMVGLLLLVAGCAVNPATGQRQLSLMGEGTEIRLGTDADRDIVGAMGLVDDPTLQAYIQTLGETMAAISERPQLPWTFRVLDDPVVNAFALPGGYIYVTRGILAHFNSEAELAGVLGHEIGHVTARHGVQQVSRAQLAQIGLGVGAILAPELSGVLDLASAGLGLLFLSYGRDAEREADDLGLRYMTRLGYDPSAMAETFQTLARSSGSEDGARIPGFLSTHPDPLSRRDRILAAVAAGTVEGERVDRDGYLARMEGLLYGVNPRYGFFSGATLLHPAWGLRMRFPEGWTHQAFRQGVQGTAQDQRSLLLLARVPEPSPQAARIQFIEELGLRSVSAPRLISVQGLGGEEIAFQGETQGGARVRGIARFLAHDDVIYRVVAMATEAAWESRSAGMREAMDTLQPLQDPAILAVQPARIQLHRVPETMSLARFQERFPSSVSLRELAILNGLEPGDSIPAGLQIKRVVGGEIPAWSGS